MNISINDNLNNRIQEFIELLNNIISIKDIQDYTNKDSFVIAVTAPYGDGKTTFANKLYSSLDTDYKDQYTVCYLNLWKESYLPPITHLSKALFDSLFVYSKIDNGIKDIFLKINSYVQLNPKLFGVGVDVSKAIEDLFNDTENPIKKFHSLISNYSKNKPIVFLLDELDRCDPHYVNNYLKNIHHFFDISNCIFLLFVEPVYLENLDKRKGILEKFIDIRIPLYSNKAIKSEQSHKLTVLQELVNIQDIANLVDYYSLSIRDIKHIKLQMHLLNIHNKDVFQHHKDLWFFILLFKHCNYSLFSNIFNSVDYINIIKQLDIDNKKMFSSYKIKSPITDETSGTTVRAHDTDLLTYSKTMGDLIEKLEKRISIFPRKPTFIVPPRNTLQYLILQFSSIIFYIHGKHSNIPNEMFLCTKEFEKNYKMVQGKDHQFWHIFLYLIYNFGQY